MILSPARAAHLLTLALCGALCAALAGCGATSLASVAGASGAPPDSLRAPGSVPPPVGGQAAIPDRPSFRPRRLPAKVPTFRLTYTSYDIRWIEVAIHAGDAWVYDEILSGRTKFRAISVPTGYAWVFLAAYDAWGYNIVANADGYVYNLVYVRNGSISSLDLNLPLL